MSTRRVIFSTTSTIIDSRDSRKRDIYEVQAVKGCNFGLGIGKIRPWRQGIRVSVTLVMMF